MRRGRGDYGENSENTAQVLVECLQEEGVDTIFGIPGEETLDLMFAIKESKIRFIDTRHEQGAAFMADVYGRLTGKAGVCLSTLGPGATHIDLPNDIAKMPADVNKIYQPNVKLVGDISNSLRKILKITSREVKPDFALKLKAMMEKEQAEMAADASYPMKPTRILADVRKVMGKKDIVLSDVGAHRMWIARHYHCYEPINEQVRDFA